MRTSFKDALQAHRVSKLHPIWTLLTLEKILEKLHIPRDVSKIIEGYATDIFNGVWLYSFLRQSDHCDIENTIESHLSSLISEVHRQGTHAVLMRTPYAQMARDYIDWARNNAQFIAQVRHSSDSEVLDTLFLGPQVWRQALIRRNQRGVEDLTTSGLSYSNLHERYSHLQENDPRIICHDRNSIIQQIARGGRRTLSRYGHPTDPVHNFLVFFMILFGALLVIGYLLPNQAPPADLFEMKGTNLLEGESRETYNGIIKLGFILLACAAGYGLVLNRGRHFSVQELKTEEHSLNVLANCWSFLRSLESKPQAAHENIPRQSGR